MDTPITSEQSDDLKKNISGFQFFAIGFGCTIGVAWVVVLGDYLSAAGPFGASLGFLLGGAVISLIALCYAELATTIPRAGGEAAFARAAFGPATSFAIGWFLVAMYISVCAFEAISIAWIIQILLPDFSLGEAYTAFGQSVTWEMLGLGALATFAICFLHWQGVNKVAGAQSIFTWIFLAICFAFIIAAALDADFENVNPGFSSLTYSSWTSGTLWLFATAPFWLAGFQIVVQAVEERSPSTSLTTVAWAVVGSLIAAAIFYVLIILSAALVGPWEHLAQSEFPAMTAFESAFGSAWVARAAMIAALIGLLTTWNTVMLAAARIMLEMARSDLLPKPIAKLHPKFGSPSTAILIIAAGTMIGLLGGRGAIIPIVNLAALIIAAGFAITAASVLRLRKAQPELHRPFQIPGGVFTARLALFASILMIGYLFYESIWKALSSGAWTEVSVLSIWALLGVVVFKTRKPQSDVEEAG